MNTHETQLIAVAKALDSWIFSPGEPASRLSEQEIVEFVENFPGLFVFYEIGVLKNFPRGWYYSFYSQEKTLQFDNFEQSDLHAGPFESKRAAQIAAFRFEKLYLYN